MEDGYRKEEVSARQNLHICYAFGKSKPYINDSSCKKKRKSQNRVAFGVKRGGKRVPKIDCSNTTRLCIFNAQSSFSSWEKHRFIFPLSPSFHLSASPLVSW